MPETVGKASDKKGKWVKVEVTCPSELTDALSNFLGEIGAQGVFQEESDGFQSSGSFGLPARNEVMKAYMLHDHELENRIASLKTYTGSLSQLFPDLEEVRFTTEPVPDHNWGEEWKKYFKPLRVSKNIVIKPTWERYTPAARDIIVEIDPGMAFGTGQHPSTRMCLEAIEDILLKDRVADSWRVLDVGMGTGILGISCAKLGAEKVVCVDVDKKAAEIARENVLINHVEDKVTVINCDVHAIHDSFNLVVANLTAKMLIRLRTHLLSLLEDHGYLIISGIIDQNRNDIEAHFMADQFYLHRMLTEKEWVCYIFRKRGG